MSFEKDLDDDLEDISLFDCANGRVINNAKFNITKPLFMGQRVRMLQLDNYLQIYF